MPDTQDIIINTSPIIALVAALEDLSVLQMYRDVWVPLEVKSRLRSMLRALKSENYLVPAVVVVEPIFGRMTEIAESTGAC